MVNIIAAVNESKEKKIRIHPCHTNRASEAGNECTRYLVLARTRGMEKTPHDVGLQYIFDEGNRHEAAVLQDLAKAGVVIIEQQRDFEWKEMQITGHIDGKVLDGKEAYPIEIKSMSPIIWQTVNTYEDMVSSKYPWVRKYPAQIQLYMLMNNCEVGVFLLKNKSNGRLKQINVSLDYEYSEKILDKLSLVNDHIQNESLPECMQYDQNICGNCGFYQICLPDIKNSPMDIISNPALEEKLKKREELKPLQIEYNKIDKSVKEALKGMERAMIGDFIVTGKETKRKAYTVEESTPWTVKIDRL